MRDTEMKFLGTRQGFSFLEILLVVVITGLLAGMALPRMRAAGAAWTLRQTAQELAATLRYARGRAVLHHARVRWDSNPRTRSFKLAQAPVTAVSSDKGYRRIAHALAGPRPFPAGIRVDARPGAITFYPDGTMDPGRIELCHQDQCYTVSTRGPDNRIRVLRGRFNG
jgi:type II secretion system protein H